MIGLLLDGLYFIVFVLAGLASVRATGSVLNARDRRRHVRCLRNIELLEIANGYREAPLAVRANPLYDFFPHRYALLNDLVEQQRGAKRQWLVDEFDAKGQPRIFAPAGAIHPKSALAEQQRQHAQSNQALVDVIAKHATGLGQ